MCVFSSQVLWGILSWKVFGLTDLSKDASFSDVLKSYKATMTVPTDRESEIAGMNEGGADSSAL